MAGDGTHRPGECNDPDHKLCDRFDPVNRPKHYATLDPEPIVVIENWNLGFCLGQVIKYLSRAGRKDPTKTVEDLSKARWYLDREIARLKKGA